MTAYAVQLVHCGRDHPKPIAGLPAGRTCDHSDAPLTFHHGLLFEVATLVLGAANADAQKTIDNATAAHRTDQPHKPLNFVTVVIEKVSVLSRVKARQNVR